MQRIKVRCSSHEAWDNWRKRFETACADSMLSTCESRHNSVIIRQGEDTSVFIKWVDGEDNRGWGIFDDEVVV